MNQQILKELLTYDNKSGVFIWKVKPSKKVKAGSVAGTLSLQGYIKIRIFGKEYRAHRLAWMYEYGEFPNGILDHIDQNKLNNSINNLRIVSISENGHNTKLYSTNKSGHKNVFWDKRVGKYSVSLCFNNKPKRIGYYMTLEDAIEARDKFIDLLIEFQNVNH